MGQVESREIPKAENNNNTSDAAEESKRRRDDFGIHVTDGLAGKLSGRGMRSIGYGSGEATTDKLRELEDIVNFQEEQLNELKEKASALRNEVDAAYEAGKTDGERGLTETMDRERKEELERCEAKMREAEESLLSLANERMEQVKMESPTSVLPICQKEYAKTLQCYQSLKRPRDAISCAGVVKAFFACADHEAKSVAAKRLS